MIAFIELNRICVLDSFKFCDHAFLQDKFSGSLWLFHVLDMRIKDLIEFFHFLIADDLFTQEFLLACLLLD